MTNSFFQQLFNQMCSQGFFSSDEFFAGLLHILTAIGVPIHLFGAYMILTKTPQKMQSVKSNMLLLHCAGAFLDVWFTFIAIPVITIPGCSGYFLGVTVSLGIPTVVQSYLCISFTGALAVTVLLFFEDRYNRLVKNGKVNWKRPIYVMMHYTFAIVFPIPGYLNIPEQVSAKVVHKQNIPCIPSDVINRPDYFVLTISDKTIIYCIFSVTILVLSQGFFFTGCIFWHLFHINPVSQNTVRLQKQFFLALCIQIMAPLILLSIPVFYIVFAIHFDYYNQAATNIALATI
nr:protein K02E2.5 [imported] - Caenorhabditis elegans [Caenorhabditis elegans]